ncbi:MAG TPA: hypothetical protein VGC13_15330 [Longimicrobium sp.]|jgi:hypothetical protein|uniref:hypothetical protein n=1 Tax=Longimicrobium sp. TaxID=2029185 RepID=UPI002ED7E9ED
MRRLHLLEIEDQPWCPAVLRDAATDFLQFMIVKTDTYAPALPLLQGALERVGTRQVVDLCSGGGGPWPGLLPQLDSADAPVQVRLTDRYPNREAFERANERTGGRLAFHAEPVDATALPEGLTGFRTLFTAFHHFPPAAARAILADAVRGGQGIGVFEATQRSVPSIIATAFSPLIVLLVTPFIHPFRWSRLFWTYVIPLVPLLVLFDGLVSCLRTYSPRELREMADSLGAPGYTWEIGEAKGRAPVPVTYLLGTPPRQGDPSAAA